MMRTILLTSLIILTAMATAQIPTNGLVGYYAFAGNAKDSSSNANHGTVNGATLTTDRLGRANHAYYFDAGLSDYIQIGTKNLLLNTFTYSLWANYDALPPSGNAMFCLGIGSSGGDQGISMQNDYLGRSTGWCGGGYNTSPPMYPVQQFYTSSAGKWYHVLLSRDTNCLSIYLDGKLLDTFSTVNTRVPYYGKYTPEALIGMRPSGIQGFNGKIDDVRIYNRALTASEIKALSDENRLGIKEVANSAGISLYPNPASSTLHIAFNNPAASFDHTLQLFNTTGQEVLSQKITGDFMEIDLTSIQASGLYIARITNTAGGEVYRNKLLILP